MREDKRLDFVAALVLAALSLALYALTLAPSVMPGDSAECQYAAYLLYLVHPTGYPLYLLLGWAWTHLLPLGDVAYRLNLFSAFWAALTVALVYLVSLKLLAQTLPGQRPLLHRLAAALGALALAVSETFWNRSLSAGIRTFHAFFVALLLYLLLRWAEDVQRDRLLLAAAFVCGLSLAHHRTTVLLLPGALVFVVGALLKARRALEVRRLLLLLALMLLPLLLYLYIPLRGPLDQTRNLEIAADKSVVLYESTFQEFRDYLLGSGYMDWVLPLEGLGRAGSLWERLLSQFTLPGVLLGLLGLGRLASGRRWGFLALTGLAFLCNSIFALIYFVEMRYLYIPVYLVFALWVALGGATLAELAGRLRLRGAAWVGVAVAALLLLLPLSVLRLNYPLLDQSRNRDLPEFWQRVLSEPLPPGAIVVGNDRNEMQAMWYYQFVEGQRPDLVNMFPRIGGDIANDNVGVLLDDLLRLSDRPIFLAKEMPGIEIKARLEPFGSMYRVVGKAAQEPQRRRQVTLGGAVELVGYDQEPHSIEPGKGAIVTLYWRVLRPLDSVHSSYVHLVDESGSGVVQSDHVPGNDYYPTTLWQPGEVLADRHVLAVYGGVPAGVYRLVAGMYSNQDAAQLGPGITIGQVAVKKQVQTAPGAMAHEKGADWGGAIKLLGYDLERQGGRLALTLHWQALRPVDEDYTVFVHVLDEKGEVIAQADGQPRGGSYPTSVWDAGEVVDDLHEIPLEAGPESRLRLEIGLYLLTSGERLPLVDGQGRTAGDSLLLAEAGE